VFGYHEKCFFWHWQSFVHNIVFHLQLRHAAARFVCDSALLVVYNHVSPRSYLQFRQPRPAPLLVSAWTSSRRNAARRKSPCTDSASPAHQTQAQRTIPTQSANSAMNRNRRCMRIVHVKQKQYKGNWHRLEHLKTVKDVLSLCVFISKFSFQLCYFNAPYTLVMC